MEYKIQAVKLAKEIEGAKAAAESGIPENTLYAWMKAAREGRLDTGSGSHTPQTAINLAEELTLLRRQVREQEKEIRRLKEENEFLEEAGAFFAASRRKSARGRYKYLANKDRPWKYQDLADAMRAIAAEDECNDTYGRIRMYQALLLKQPEGVRIPGERTVYRVMEETGLSHRPERKPDGITKAGREARRSDGLLKRDFTSAGPLKKCVTDITGIKAKDGKLCVPAIFGCFGAAVPGLAMDANMKAALCRQTPGNAVRSCPALREAVIHSGRGTQYTSGTYRKAVRKYGILQSMNSTGGRCHDNARCESMRARMKEELLYGRYHAEEMNIEELKTLIWRCFTSYWNNRRICSANEGLSPMAKRQRYYKSLDAAV